MQILENPTKLATALLSAGAVVALIVTVGVTRPASALPAYAAQTKLPCGACHVSKGGGGPLTSKGSKFQANGHKL